MSPFTTPTGGYGVVDILDRHYTAMTATTRQLLQSYKIYTDASSDNDINIGAAFFDPQLNISMKLKINSKVSIMCAELIAISEAVSYIASLNHKYQYVILTDSKSALQHLARCTSNFRGTPIAYSILKSIDSLTKKNVTVVLQWIPAHIGLVGNEVVDRLAKEASSDGILRRYLPFFADFLYKVKERCDTLWKEYFNERSLTKAIWYKTIQPNLSRSSWVDKANMGRTDIVTALRLRSGHIPMNSFAFLMGKVESPNCVECGQIEDVVHILVECVRIEAERVNFCNKYNVNRLDIGFCNSILASPLSEEARILYKIVQVGLKRR
ncbi:unnamed protein product [Parnassius mnemosyne]|uniref:ribonuclease H n=1 Tax=Parnassius mnemosyne TaxID=213953 RepID=A0AAV1L9E5_9NEOP